MTNVYSRTSYIELSFDSFPVSAAITTAAEDAAMNKKQPETNISSPLHDIANGFAKLEIIVSSVNAQ